MIRCEIFKLVHIISFCRVLIHGMAHKIYLDQAELEGVQIQAAHGVIQSAHGVQIQATHLLHFLDPMSFKVQTANILFKRVNRGVAYFSYFLD